MNDSLYNCTNDRLELKNGSAQYSLNETVVKDILNDHVFKTSTVLDPMSVCLVVLYIPVFIVGILGNGVLTVLITCRSQLRNITNIFLCNLAIADLAGKIFVHVFVLNLFFLSLQLFSSVNAPALFSRLAKELKAFVDDKSAFTQIRCYVYLVTELNGITCNVTKIQIEKSSTKFYYLIN